MKKSLHIWLVLVVIIIVIAGAFYFDEETASFNWSQTYSNEESEPFDLTLFRKSLELSFKDQFIEIKRPISSGELDQYTDACFIYISNYAPFDSSNTALLRHFAERGNSVFISAEYLLFPIEKVDEDPTFHDDSEWPTIRAKYSYQYLYPAVKENQVAIHFAIQNEVERHDWSYFDLSEFANNQIDSLGGFRALDRDYLNFISIPFGKGQMLYHASPLLFTNYHYRKKNVFEHVNKILAVAPRTTLIYYNPDFRASGNANMQSAESPLSFILGHRSLRLAWYGLLCLALIYVLSGIRRDQRAIPIIRQPENNSVAFLGLLSKLYRKKGNHKYLIGVQEKILRRHLFRKYHLPIGAADAAFIREANIRLNIPENEIQQLFGLLHRSKNNSTITEVEVMKINDQLKSFYKKCP